MTSCDLQFQNTGCCVKNELQWAGVEPERPGENQMTILNSFLSSTLKHIWGYRKAMPSLWLVMEVKGLFLLPCTLAWLPALSAKVMLRFCLTSQSDQKVWFSTGSGEKLVVSDLLEPVKTSSSLAAVKKQLNRVKSKKTVELPLHREEIERVSQRKCGPLRGRN